MGFPKSGKTVFGKHLSEIWNCAWHDLDHWIVNAYEQQCKQTRSCREIWNFEGAGFFRSLEANCLNNFLEKHQNSQETWILSLGGGVPLQDKNYQRLVEFKKMPRALIVALIAPAEVIFSRMQKKGFPSFIDRNNVEESFHLHYNARNLVYQKLATFVFETKYLSVQDSLDQLNQKIKEFLK
jgi:shikimate kinase